MDGALALTHELLGPRPGVNERNVRRIRQGMTRGEAEAVLGGRLWPSPYLGLLFGGSYTHTYYNYIDDVQRELGIVVAENTI